MLEAALDAGAEDFRREDDVYVVTTDPASLPRREGGARGEGHRADRGRARDGAEEHRAGDGQGRRRARCSS